MGVRLPLEDQDRCWYDSSKFAQFCSDNWIIHEKTSPYHPRGNGHAECHVKQMKNLLVKLNGNLAKFKECLAEWRNGPKADGFSQAQRFFGRRCRGKLPARPSAYNHVQAPLPAVKVEPNKKDQPRFEIGQPVRIQNNDSKKWSTTGEIIDTRESGHSYVVKDSEGGEWIKNRKFLKAIPRHVSFKT